MLDELDLKFAYIDDVIDKLDVLIEGTLVIEPKKPNKFVHMVEKLFAIKLAMILLWIWNISYSIKKRTCI
ncbi:Uncharacterised protein [Actinobacillus equuli]|nr:Uncharacterised protein [Actinobacillus equuli]